MGQTSSESEGRAHEAPTAVPAPAPASDPAAFIDPSFVSQLLGSMDVDPNDPLIHAALAQFGGAGAAKGPGDSDGDERESKRKKREGDK